MWLWIALARRWQQHLVVNAPPRRSWWWVLQGLVFELPVARCDRSDRFLRGRQQQAQAAEGPQGRMEYTSQVVVIRV